MRIYKIMPGCQRLLIIGLKVLSHFKSGAKFLLGVSRGQFKGAGNQAVKMTFIPIHIQNFYALNPHMSFRVFFLKKTMHR